MPRRALDHLQIKTAFLLNRFDYLHAILCIAHGRRGAGAVGIDAEDLHQLFIGLHHVDHHLLTLFRHLAEREDILAQAQRHAHEHQFAHAFQSDSLVVEGFDEQTGSVGTNINSC